MTAAIFTKIESSPYTWIISATTPAEPDPDGHPCNDFGVAYSSPWWFDPA